jgi:hypothetical protein
LVANSGARRSRRFGGVPVARLAATQAALEEEAAAAARPAKKK